MCRALPCHVCPYHTLLKVFQDRGRTAKAGGGACFSPYDSATTSGQTHKQSARKILKQAASLSSSSSYWGPPIPILVSLWGFPKSPFPLFLYQSFSDCAQTSVVQPSLSSASYPSCSYLWLISQVPFHNKTCLHKSKLRNHYRGLYCYWLKPKTSFILEKNSLFEPCNQSIHEPDFSLISMKTGRADFEF
jgi:hypothetical protein